jgi:phage-related protein
MKILVFEGDTLLRFRAFPEVAKQRAAYEIDRVLHDFEPENWEPFPTVGRGVRAIRIEVNGHYRVLYIEKPDNKVHILHAYEKKSLKTRQTDIDLAKPILESLLEG